MLASVAQQQATVFAGDGWVHLHQIMPDNLGQPSSEYVIRKD